MAISITGISLYRPTSSFKREFFKDNYSEIIGVKDDVTISDQVTYADNSNLIGVADTLTAFASQNTQLRNISYNGGSGYGRITGINIDSDSDFVNILKYSISIEVYPTNVALNNKWGLSASDGVRELTCTESGDDPKDKALISLPDGNQYWNKLQTFSFNIQVSCSRVDNDTSAKQLAKNVINKLKRVTPELLKRSIPTFNSSNVFYTALEESYSEQGSASLQITASVIPDQGNSSVLLESIEKTVNAFGGEKKYKTKQYRATFKSLSNMSLGDTGISQASDSIAAIGAAESIISYFTSNRSGTPDVDTPGIDLVCTTDIPQLPESTCYNTVSVGIEKNYAEQTATAVIDQTTEPTNCDGDGYVVEYSINTNKNKRTYAELFGWDTPVAIVQDLQCEATETKDVTVNVSSMAKCLTNELKNKAEAKYNEIANDILSSGTLIKHTLTINNGRCSINASFIMSKGI